MNDSKNCNRCSTVKPFSEFHRDAKGKHGLSAYCKECNKARSTQLRKDRPDLKKNSALKYMFGITLDRYNEILELQGGVCAICRQPESNGRSLAVDHDHSCCPGKKSCGNCVRSLLCGDCNMGLGKFKDDPELLKLAIRYLNR